MNTVVTDNGRGARFTDCVTVCPVTCFHGDDEMLYIDPKVCIDCGACVSKCPVQAIYEDPIPKDKRRWIKINAERASRLPGTYRKLDPQSRLREYRPRWHDCRL